MRSNFWQKLRTPILALAPLAGYTDAPMRYLCASYGAQVLYSEMVSATAIYYGNGPSLELAKRGKGKGKYIVQLFGSNPEHFATATKIISEKIKPDGIDINFGCPVPKIIKQGAGSALFQNLALSRQVLEAVLANTKLPVSIKIRAGAGKITAVDFVKNISDLKISAIMIHGRTLKQGFSGPIDLEIVHKIRPYFAGRILINGGINNLSDFKSIIKTTNADGVGIGRGALGHPEIFQEIRENKISRRNPKALALKHAKLFVKMQGEKNIIELRKQLPFYFQNMGNVKTIRTKLVRINSLADVIKILKV